MRGLQLSAVPRLRTAVRPDKDVTLLNIAWEMSQQSTCSRLQVGAVIARDTRPIMTGYNGAPAGLPHCDHDGTETHCTTAIHAERNAVGYAAREGIATCDATLYLTHAPCLDCASVVQAAGIRRVVYHMPYRSPAGVMWLMNAGVRVEHFGVTGVLA